MLKFGITKTEKDSYIESRNSKFYIWYTIAIAYVLLSFAYYCDKKIEGVIIYYVIVFFILIVLNKKSIRLFFGKNYIRPLKPQALLQIVYISLASNILLVLFQYNFKFSFVFSSYISKYDTIPLFLLVNPIRIFCEELVFRGFLRIQYINSNARLFWFFNILQGLAFGLIHWLFIDFTFKSAFFAYALILSVTMGWFNRKYKSLIPSFLIHWLNGIQSLIFLY